MKLIDMTCPSCGATMKIHDDSSQICCDYCGKTYILEEDLLEYHEKKQKSPHQETIQEIPKKKKEDRSEKKQNILVESIDSQKIDTVSNLKLEKPTKESDSSEKNTKNKLLLAILTIIFILMCIFAPYISEHNNHTKAFAKGIELFEQHHKNIFGGKVIFDSLYLKDVTFDYHYEIDKILSDWDTCIIDISLDNFQSKQIRNYLTYEYNSEASKILCDSMNSFREALYKNGGYIRETYEYFGQTIELHIVIDDYQKGRCHYNIYDLNKNRYEYCDYGSHNEIKVNGEWVYLKRYK